MKISVKGGGNLALRQVSMGAAAVMAALNKSNGIVLTLGDNVQLNAEERTIPANMMTGTAAQTVTVLSASGIVVDGLDGERVINVTRILSQACPGCNDLNACAKYLEDKDVSTITVDIETLTQYGNAKRFTNIRLS